VCMIKAIQPEIMCCALDIDIMTMCEHSIKKWSEVQIMASFFSSEALRPRVGSLRLASDI